MIYELFVSIYILCHCYTPKTCNHFAVFLLRCFMQRCSLPYGSFNMVYYVHASIRLADDALRLGSPDGIFCFP